MHANAKALEVRERKLKHTQKNFAISILTADDFAVEVALLAKLDLYQFDVAAPPTESDRLAKWMKGRSNLSLVSNLERKAARIGAGKSQTTEGEVSSQDRGPVHRRGYRVV